MRLKDKIAVITGGAKGIGEAIATLFAKEGAIVYIWDVLDSGNEVAEKIQSLGFKAYFQQLSVTDEEAVSKAVRKIFTNESRIDILINNAGILRDRTLLKMSSSEWDVSIDINLKGPFICTRAIAPYMIKNGYGRIISASSISGMRGNFGQSNYSAAKSGLIGMTKTWALELGKHGITANVIAPGFTQTAMTETIPDSVKDVIRSQIPVRFLADPIDIAHGYLFLASDEARYISGVCLNIDGGFAR